MNYTSIGTSSFAFSSPVYFQSAASVVGKKEGEGPLSDFFDEIIRDPLFGGQKWEEAESILQKKTALLAIEKAKLSPEQIHLAFAGDLLAQGIASSFGIASLKIPFYGLYGACSTSGEALSLGALAVTAGLKGPVLCAASSHFASAEKEFRYPLGYGSQRPLSASWTVTGCGAFLLGSEPPAHTGASSGFAAVRGITVGRVIDYGLKDSMNMGGCMAPAAADTIAAHFQDFHSAPADYDGIITGDLGQIGRDVLLHLLSQKGISLTDCHHDCGLMIFDPDKQDTHAGGSGCGCAASVLAAVILPKVISGEWKRILFVPTGALLSKVSFNEGDSVPGIAHAVLIEHVSLS